MEGGRERERETERRGWGGERSRNNERGRERERDFLKRESEISATFSLSEYETTHLTGFSP